MVYGLVLDLYPRTAEIVSGKAWGIDYIGECVAEIMNISVAPFPAQWNGPLKKGAGFARNVTMAKYGDALLSVNSGSSGSQHMIECMKKLNKPHHEEIIK